MSKKSYTLWSIAAVCVVGLLAAYVIFLFIKRKKAEKLRQQEREADEQDDFEPSDNITLENYRKITDTLNSLGATDNNYQRLITAQAMFESDDFTSEVFRYNNNFIGMKGVKVRPTTQSGERTTPQGTIKYGWYDTVEKCAEDVLLWTRYSGLPESYPDLTYATVQLFVGALKKKGYFEDSLTIYVKGVNTKLNELNSLIAAG